MVLTSLFFFLLPLPGRSSSEVGVLVLFADVFNLRSWGVPPSIHRLILFYVSQHRSLPAIGQKKADSHSLVIARYTRNRDRSEPPVPYLNNSCPWTELRSTPGQAEPIVQYFWKKWSTVLSDWKPNPTKGPWFLLILLVLRYFSLG